MATMTGKVECSVSSAGRNIGVCTHPNEGSYRTSTSGGRCQVEWSVTYSSSLPLMGETTSGKIGN